MKFEVFRGTTTYMGTEYVSCIPFESLRSMQAAGFKFRIDGKVAPLSAVMALKSTVPNTRKNVLTGLVVDDDGDSEPRLVEISLSDGSPIVVDESSADDSIITVADVVIEEASNNDDDKGISQDNHEDKSEELEEAKLSVRKKRGRSSKKVYCKETDTTYGSMSEAGRALGIDPALVSYSANSGRPTKGYTFSLVSN